jgi:hypothetical protein
VDQENRRAGARGGVGNRTVTDPSATLVTRFDPCGLLVDGRVAEGGPDEVSPVGQQAVFCSRTLRGRGFADRSRRTLGGGNVMSKICIVFGSGHAEQ